MSSIINAGKDLLNILPPAAVSFGRGYGLVSGLQYLGMAQSMNPLTTAAMVTSMQMIENLMDLTCKNIKYLQGIHELRKQEKEIDRKLQKHGYSPISDILEEPRTPKVQKLINDKETITEQLSRYNNILLVARFAIFYFNETTGALVTGAMTSAVTYLPGSALTICSSLSITPIGLIIGTIFATGFLISKYQKGQQQHARKQSYENNKTVNDEKFKQCKELMQSFEEIESDQNKLDDTINEKIAAYEKACETSKTNIRLLKEIVRNESNPVEQIRFQQLIDQHKGCEEILKFSQKEVKKITENKS